LMLLSLQNSDEVYNFKIAKKIVLVFNKDRIFREIINW
jgi:hypothetical protein